MTKDKCTMGFRGCLRRVISATILSIGAMTSQTTGDEIGLRGGEATILGEIKTIDDAGVMVEFSSPGARETRLLGWDEVRGIAAAESRHNEAYARYASWADLLWRARSRVARLDFAGAAPLLEEASTDKRSRKGRSAAVVVEGMLRVTLAQGQTAAAAPWWLRMRAIGDLNEAGGPYSNLTPVIEGRSGLCWAIPPVFADEEVGKESQSRLIEVVRDDVTGETAVLAELYLAAARRSGGEEVPTPARPVSQEMTLSPEEGDVGLGPRRRDAILLVWALVAAEDTDERIRADAIGECNRWAEDPGPAAVWARYGRGAARIASGDETTVKKGLVDLLSLATSHAGRGVRVLEAAGLARAAEGLDLLNRRDAASGVRNDLRERYPDLAPMWLSGRRGRPRSE